MNSMESRIRRLEASLTVTQSPCDENTNKDIQASSSESPVAAVKRPLESRLEHLSQTIDTKIPLDHRIQVNRDLNLLEALSPSGMILFNHPTSAVTQDPAPLLFRKQEILARYDQFQNALEQLAQIRDLLVIMNPRLSKDIQSHASKDWMESGDVYHDDDKGKRQVSMDHILSSPILSGPEFAFASDEENLQRLNTCIEETLDIHQRALVLSNRVDVLVERYSHAMNIVNEKLILLQDHHL